MRKRTTIAAGTRYAVVALALLAFVRLLSFDAQNTFSDTLHPHAVFIVSLTEFGFSALVAFICLAVGALVFLYVRQRWFGFLVFTFLGAMMTMVSCETGALLDLPGPQLVTDIASTLALYLLSVLLLVFPHNYLARRTRMDHEPRTTGIRAAHIYLTLLTALLFDSLVNDPLVAGLLGQYHVVLPTSLGGKVGGELLALLPLVRGGKLFALLSVLGSGSSLLLAYRRPSSAWERQQVSILAIGMLLAFVPFVILTLVPLLIFGSYSSPYVFPSQVSTLSFVLLPIAFGYAILRYHVLVLDRYIRSAATLLVGGIFLAVAAYLEFITSSLLLPGDWPQLKWWLAALILLLIPAAWRIAPMVTGRIFASDLSSVHHLLYGQYQAADLVTPDDSSLEAVAHQITHATRTILGTRRACFLVFHRESGSYHPADPAWADAGDGAWARSLFSLLGQMNRAQQHWLDAREPIFARLAGSRRPLYLSDARFPPRANKTLHPPRLLATATMPEDPLLVPVMALDARGGNELLGVLVLGSRDNRLPYGGPDFELIDLILLRFSWMLGKALAEAQSQEHLTMLRALYNATSTALPPTQVAEDIVRAYALAAATAMNASAEAWLYDESTHMLHRAARAGDGHRLPYGEVLQPQEASDWLSWFYEGTAAPEAAEQERTRPLVLEPPTFPFAWLPLVRGGRPLGVLVLTYRPPHRYFSPAERQVLEIFAHQMAAALENARVARALRAATDEATAQEGLKSQAMKASLQYLLQPLMTLQRYTAILRQYNLSLPPELHLAPPPLQVGPPPPQVSASFPPLEGLDALTASIGASLTQLHALATAPSGNPATSTSLYSRFRREVNAILSRFDSEDGEPLVLVIATDPDFRALLCITLDLCGYSFAEVATGQQAVEWLKKQNKARGPAPSAFLLDVAALGGKPLGNLVRELQQALGQKLPFPPLLLMGGDDSPAAQEQVSYLPLALPFSVRSLAEYLQTYLPRRAPEDD